MKRNNFLSWIIIILLLVVIAQLVKISSKLEYIDWDTRNILGKLSH